MIHILLFSACLFGPDLYARDLDKLYEKADFTVGDAKLEAFVADDDQRRAQGLMFIDKLPPDRGMLFVFDEPQTLRFWMKNTLIPLAIGFFDRRCKLIDAQEMTVAGSVFATPPSYQSRGEAVFALEMNAGWFTRHKLANGAQLKLRGETRAKPLKTALSRCK